MIKNEQQYHITKEWLQKFKRSVAEIDGNEDLKADPTRWQLYRDAYQSQVDEFTEEIEEYERITHHDCQTPILLKIDDINYLSQILIKARMSAKLTQQELASLAGLTLEQIQLYEDKDYQGASFVDVLSVFDALDIKVKAGEFLVPLDTLRRTPVTKEELLGSRDINQELSNTLENTTIV